jgi:AcrR family transcriptional regulator
MSDERRRRLRLEVSREAARLFWEQGVAATSGDQIAEAVGISTRTLWRHFRSKESCVEPLLLACNDWFLEMLRDWPRDKSLGEHFTEAVPRVVRTPQQHADDVAAVRMTALGQTEPAIRIGWLMACDEVERELITLLATRHDRPTDDVEIRIHAAAATAAIRAVSDAADAFVANGHKISDFGDPFELMARAVHQVTGGVIGGPVDALKI